MSKKARPYTIYDCPGSNPEFARPKPDTNTIPLGCSFNKLFGKWDFQKDSMHTSKGFSKNQIKIINRMIRQEIRNLIRQEIRNYMENQNYDYYDN